MQPSTGYFSVVIVHADGCTGSVTVIGAENDIGKSSLNSSSIYFAYFLAQMSLWMVRIYAVLLVLRFLRNITQVVGVDTLPHGRILINLFSFSEKKKIIFK